MSIINSLTAGVVEAITSVGQIVGLCPYIRRPATPKKENPTDLICELWSIPITDSIRDGMSGRYRYIDEAYFPELDMSLNQGDWQHSNINVLIGHSSRYKLDESSSRRSKLPICNRIILLQGDDADAMRGLFERQNALLEAQIKAKVVFGTITSPPPAS